MIQAGDWLIRRLQQEDAQHLAKWLSDERVLQYYEGRDRPHDAALVQKHFFDEGDTATRCLIIHATKPIGYVQFYALDNEDKAEYGYERAANIYGMDQFIGEPDFWNRGIGTQLVQTMLEYLASVVGVQKVVMDPQISNERALRCYEKCGFVKVKMLPLHESHEGSMRDCWLLEWSPSTGL
ncbi:N-acetyltransferase [Brevibacillus reuszeri]|uniref:2-aminoglycoside phosphotransferase n=1 Tax=Brevibacillus reuszeri TaxID=54915 RepID=A0A0K9YZ26_9BACL|nr:GNAT family N-acetyltransferase [Brevibacillus reuszeri]KNB73906.1 2-aminoglycoside phosphotransferase [Brevibacillus reuszeri]MED1859945.1 GNAT family N-acetyltransferase [Brevibacillus reuszeri]GED71021.1 N-acetyltransferase [Brevibacillus reuszeri]